MKNPNEIIRLIEAKNTSKISKTDPEFLKIKEQRDMLKENMRKQLDIIKKLESMVRERYKIIYALDMFIRQVESK